VCRAASVHATTSVHIEQLSFQRLFRVIASVAVIHDVHEGDVIGQTSLPKMVSLAVHELTTPMTVVGGYLRMLLREQGGPLSEKQRKMVEEADRACARIAALIAEMREFGKLESRELKLARMEFNLAALVKEAAAGLHENDRGVRLELRGGDAALTVTGDRLRIAGAIKALLHSAIRERGEPGIIVAECSVIDTWGVVTIGDEAVLPSLTGGARGIPPAFDEWRGGMGLALPVARRVLEAHGGALWSATEGPSRAASALRLPLAS
jgi:signal transduction histidine kinase